jgi:hypothetical protein
MEHAKNLRKAEIFRRARQPDFNQSLSNHNICIILNNIGELLVSCGMFLQRCYSTAVKEK